MRLCVFLAFACVLLPAVCGIRCFTCWGVNPGHCNDVWSCAPHFDRCATTIVAENLITKECMRSDMCDNVYSNGLRCCSGDLCNGAQHAGVFVPPLLAPLAIITLFI
ncbi:CD59 glycoprotein-like [Acanthopagrus latus]|uniref:CD59 glycoprotein-like n=1 Tax=Acanthopagrus latus TaxID=8177 RepID=UPI00187C1235|nr:CD59 glycoprotein-like [Acanthopagrus latus]